MLAAGCDTSVTTLTTEPTVAPTWYSIAERAELAAQCMTEAGIEATVTSDGIGVLVTHGGQVNAALQIEGTCWEEIDRRYPAPPELSDLEAYEALVEAAECLRSEGIDVPPAPTFETWSNVGEDEDSWSPFDYISSDLFWQYHAICPQPGLGLTPND